MAVAVVYEFPEESLDAYERSLVVADGLLTRQPARLYHVCYKTDGVYTVVDVWDSLEAFEAFGELLNEVMDVFPTRLSLKIHPVHHVIPRSDG